MHIKVLIGCIFFVSFLLLYNSFRIIEFININDEANIKDKKIYRVVISFILSLFIVMLYIKYSFTLTFFKFATLVVYLMITGYIDSYTKNVYTFISQIFLIIGVLFLVMDICKGAYIPDFAIGILGTLIVTSAIALFKLLGWGDVEVFAIIALYIGGFMSIFNIFLAFAISGIGGIYRIISRNFSIKDKGALCPYIAISTYIILFLI